MITSDPKADLNTRTSNNEIQKKLDEADKTEPDSSGEVLTCRIFWY